MHPCQFILLHIYARNTGITGITGINGRNAGFLLDHSRPLYPSLGFAFPAFLAQDGKKEPRRETNDIMPRLPGTLAAKPQQR
jgi:hypothetical protein